MQKQCKITPFRFRLFPIPPLLISRSPTQSHFLPCFSSIKPAHKAFTSPRSFSIPSPFHLPGQRPRTHRSPILPNRASYPHELQYYAPKFTEYPRPYYLPLSRISPFLLCKMCKVSNHYLYPFMVIENSPLPHPLFSCYAAPAHRRSGLRNGDLPHSAGFQQFHLPTARSYRKRECPPLLPLRSTAGTLFRYPASCALRLLPRYKNIALPSHDTPKLRNTPFPLSHFLQFNHRNASTRYKALSD